jgi:uncharacterized membrane protein YphA (DoxX/SURF4 family)
MDRRLNSAWWSLRLGLGLVATAAGLDKFLNLLTYWPDYVSPLFARILPVSPQAFMYVVGVIEALVGLAILTRFTRAGAYVAMIWLLCIALNLLTAGRYFDIAARDVIMALAAYSLARLSEVRAHAAERPGRVAALHPAGVTA